MPRYLVTRHTIQHFVERLPYTRAFLVELADHGVAAQPAGMNLLMCVEAGLGRTCLMVSRHFYDNLLEGLTGSLLR